MKVRGGRGGRGLGEEGGGAMRGGLRPMRRKLGDQGSMKVKEGSGGGGGWATAGWGWASKVGEGWYRCVRERSIGLWR